MSTARPTNRISDYKGKRTNTGPSPTADQVAPRKDVDVVRSIIDSVGTLDDQNSAVKKSAALFAGLKAEGDKIEESVATGEKEVLLNKELAFVLQQNEMEMTNLLSAHNHDLEKTRQMYERILFARQERKVNKKQARKSFIAAKRRDMILQQQEKSALAAARVKETISEKRLAFDLLNAHINEKHDIQRRNQVRSQERVAANERVLLDLETRSFRKEVRNTLLKKLQVRHTHQNHINKILNDNLREFQLLELQHIKDRFELEMVSFEETGSKKIAHEIKLDEMRLKHMKELHEEKENVLTRHEAGKEMSLRKMYEQSVKKLQSEQRVGRRQLKMKNQEKIDLLLRQRDKGAGKDRASLKTGKAGSKGTSQASSIAPSYTGSPDMSVTHSRAESVDIPRGSISIAVKNLQVQQNEIASESIGEIAYRDSKVEGSIKILAQRQKNELAQLEEENRKELNDISLAYEAKFDDLEASQQTAFEILIEQQNVVVNELKEAHDKEMKMEETMHDNEMKMLVERRVLNSVLGTVSDGIINITPTGVITRFNHAAEEIFQWKSFEVIGNNIKMLMPKEHAQKHDTYLDNYLTTGNAKVVNIGRRVHGLKKDGTLFPMHLSLSELKEGEAHLFTGIVHDLTEQTAEEERQKAIESAKKLELEHYAQKLDFESKKCDDLLKQILPPSVSEALMNGLQIEPQCYESVSVFYFDLVGFTTISAQVSPLKIVGLLNDLYEAFDGVIAMYNAYKVETIGDSYMIASGVPSVINDHACELAKMALHLLEVAKNWVYTPNPDIKIRLRMGINSGPVIAGVVGTKMPKYCLFGETCMIASKMESSGSRKYD
ncbi:hypothetical protein HDV06_006925 [Boothiomyces sp. JEL0866]|nr:hypothetical protein HDV06_006925 [Boothiomyces sp. JEL0866]